MRRAAIHLGALAVALSVGALGAFAARPAPAPPGDGDAFAASVPQDAEGPAYDGRFTFVRVRFGAGAGRMRGFFGRGGEPPWAHDMPRAERNFARILEATTTADPYLDGGRVLELTDPELFKYPIAYIVEVGYWRPEDAEVRALREYLLKGGFLIVDDFRGRDIRNFQAQMARVLPGIRMRPLESDHEIFDSFFHIEEPEAFIPPTFRQFPPVYLGMYEDDDPSKRLLAIINYNNDIADYWEYSDMGFYPIDLANDAYKFGVNYVIYGMTH